MPDSISPREDFTINRENSYLGENDLEIRFGKDFVNNLFSAYKIIPQYPVLNYRIDWYIPELKIAVEFDEAFHNGNQVADKVRQKVIEKNLVVSF